MTIVVEVAELSAPRPAGVVDGDGLVVGSRDTLQGSISAIAVEEVAARDGGESAVEPGDSAGDAATRLDRKSVV